MTTTALSQSWPGLTPGQRRHNQNGGSSASPPLPAGGAEPHGSSAGAPEPPEEDRAALLITEAHGIPLQVSLTGDNRNDVTQLMPK
jgi:hypothetical protein